MSFGWEAIRYGYGTRKRFQIVLDAIGTWYVEWEGGTMDDKQLRDEAEEIVRFSSIDRAAVAAEAWAVTVGAFGVPQHDFRFGGPR